MWLSSRPWVLFPASYKLFMVVRTCSPSTWEVEAGDLGVWGHPCLPSRFQVSWRYTKPCWLITLLTPVLQGLMPSSRLLGHFMQPVCAHPFTGRQNIHSLFILIAAPPPSSPSPSQAPPSSISEKGPEVFPGYQCILYLKMLYLCLNVKMCRFIVKTICVKCTRCVSSQCICILERYLGQTLYTVYW